MAAGTTTRPPEVFQPIPSSLSLRGAWIRSCQGTSNTLLLKRVFFAYEGSWDSLSSTEASIHSSQGWTGMEVVLLLPLFLLASCSYKSYGSCYCHRFPTPLLHALTVLLQRFLPPPLKCYLRLPLLAIPATTPRYG